LPRGLPPTIVAFTMDEGRLVDLPIKQQKVVNAQNIIFGFKRLIGRQFKDEGVQDEGVQDDVEHW
jgi:molecular chaperone DnaK